MKFHLLYTGAFEKGPIKIIKWIHVGKIVVMEKCNLLLIFWIEGCRFFRAWGNLRGNT